MFNIDVYMYVYIYIYMTPLPRALEAHEGGAVAEPALDHLHDLAPLHAILALAAAGERRLLAQGDAAGIHHHVGPLADLRRAQVHVRTIQARRHGGARRRRDAAGRKAPLQGQLRLLRAVLRRPRAALEVGSAPRGRERGRRRRVKCAAAVATALGRLTREGRGAAAAVAAAAGGQAWRTTLARRRRARAALLERRRRAVALRMLLLSW